MNAKLFCSTQRRFSRTWPAIIATSLFVLAGHSRTLAAQTGKYNVLFLVVDDLRPELGCYGMPIVKSPNIDALARTGIVFNRAYCQQALCCPSRTSVLTGCRPDTTQVSDNKTHFRLHLPDVVTLPQYFKERGYDARSLGKVFHDTVLDPKSWSVQHWDAEDQVYGKAETLAELEMAKERPQGADKHGVAQAKGPAWEDPDVPDNALRDGKVADRAIAVLDEIKDKPFFLAVGFRKPHLPFVAPKKYYDLYQPEILQLASNPYLPKDMPPIAWEDSIELRLFYSGIPPKGTPIPDKTARKLIRGYCASVSYVDAQVGRVLAELDRLGLRDRTIVVLWGDHGWHLGEHQIWGKSHNFEVTTRAPLIFSVPGQAKRGVTSEALVEFVDIYPTLVDLCGIAVPAGLEGLSMVPVIEAPDRPWKQAAFSQYPRHAGKIMGYSMRTDRYRYTEWKKVDDNATMGVELYDHEKDSGENVNRAGQPEYQDLVAQLGRRLHAGWRAALPPDAKLGFLGSANISVLR